MGCCSSKTDFGRTIAGPIRLRAALSKRYFLILPLCIQASTMERVVDARALARMRSTRSIFQRLRIRTRANPPDVVACNIPAQGVALSARSDGVVLSARNDSAAARAAADRPSLPGDAPAAPAKPASICTLRAEAPIIGNVVCDGPWEFFCSIQGELRGTDLTIGPDATVVGSVIAHDVTVRGRVTGTIRAVNVKLRGAAAVEGEIFHQTLLVEEDARFDGASRPLGSG
jgi:cytoskeletal protein CcmA (bactofilin family)